ncbi:MAG: PEGA domain-containing protein [Myxococcota bacterium]
MGDFDGDGPITAVEPSPFAPGELDEDTNPGDAPEVDPFEEPTPPASVIPETPRASLVLPRPPPVSPPVGPGPSLSPGAIFSAGDVGKPRVDPRPSGGLGLGVGPALDDAAAKLARAGQESVRQKRRRLIRVQEQAPQLTWARLREGALVALMVVLSVVAVWREKVLAHSGRAPPKVVLIEDAKQRPRRMIKSWQDVYFAQQAAESSTAAAEAGAPVRQAVAGTLSVFSTPPGAQVFLDGELRGETPLVITHRSGAVQIRLQLNGYRGVTKMVAPDENGHAVFNATLEQR